MGNTCSCDVFKMGNTCSCAKKKEGGNSCCPHVTGSVRIRPSSTKSSPTSTERDVIYGQGTTKVQGDVKNLTVIIDSSTPDTSKSIPSVQKLKDVQSKFEEEDSLLMSILSSFNVPESSYNMIQSIYPKMVGLYSEDAFTMRSRYVPSRGISNLPDDGSRLNNSRQLSVEDILAQSRKSKILNLIGLPGSGKTTISRRLSKIVCKESNSACILVKFMHLNYRPRNRKFTLQQLLIDNNYPDLNTDERKPAFEWVVANQDRLLVILDGYDQASWSIKKNAPKVGYDTKQPVWDLVSNLYNKVYLPKASILLTSRPHAMKRLPKMEDVFTIHLLDLSPDDVKKLFFLFVGFEAKKSWNKLHTTAPQLVNLCGNPLLLQLVIRACAGRHANIGNITTFTRLFAYVLKALASKSDTTDIETVRSALMKLAFNLTSSKRIIMNKKDIKGVKLDLNTVHDLIISQQSSNPFDLFDGGTTLYFIHQTLQEHLAARYIHQFMSDDEFAEFVETKLFDSHWIVVGKFLFGIIFDLCKSADLQWRMTLMKDKLLQEFQKKRVRHDLIQLFSCVRECADDDVTRDAAENFPTEVLMFKTPISSSAAHALSLVLKKVRGRVVKLNLAICNLTSDSFRFIANAIKASDCSFDVIDIGWNRLSPTDITIICDIMGKINVELRMVGCFADEHGNCRDATKVEQKIIQERLNSLENRNLEVWVGGRQEILRWGFRIRLPSDILRDFEKWKHWMNDSDSSSRHQTDLIRM